MKTFEGNLVAQNMKVALVAARFNEFITSKLIGGAMDGLTRHGEHHSPGQAEQVGQLLDVVVDQGDIRGVHGNVAANAPMAMPT